MSTAQVSIELVLAGILALCAFIIPFWDGTGIIKDLLQSQALIGILGVAYLLGVIFDKLSDSILGPKETWMRLEQANEYLKKNRTFAGRDGFPQKELEFFLKKKKDGRLDWMEALKSRIRTSRELAVLGLPAAAGILIHNGIVASCSSGCLGKWIYVFVAINLILFISPIWIEMKTSDEDSGKKAIKTYHLSKNKEERKEQMELAKSQTNSAFLPYKLLLANSILAILVVWLYQPKNIEVLLIGAGGLIITLLALWTTLRISHTYMKFVSLAMPDYLDQKEDE